MKTYLNNLISEKGIDLETIIEVEGPGGSNIIPLGCLVANILQAPAGEQRAIRAILVKIDFMNGDVMHFFEHLAGAVAI